MLAVCADIKFVIKINKRDTDLYAIGNHAIYRNILNRHVGSRLYIIIG